MKFHRLDEVLGLSKFIGALIILNGPVLSPKLLNLVWPLSRHPVKYPIVCADGGANLLYDATHQGESPSRNEAISIKLEHIPTAIVGDLDSLRNDVKEWYKARGTDVISECSVNSNDFQKALRLAESLRPEHELPVVVIGGYGGRMDQTLGNFNELICAAELDKAVYWLGSDDVIMALGKGKHHISIDASREGPICGLLPVGGGVEVSTEGLKWNLDGQRLSYGREGLISTSNEIVEPVVLINTSAPIIWTAQLRLE